MKKITLLIILIIFLTGCSKVGSGGDKLGEIDYSVGEKYYENKNSSKTSAFAKIENILTIEEQLVYDYDSKNNIHIFENKEKGYKLGVVKTKTGEDIESIIVDGEEFLGQQRYGYVIADLGEEKYPNINSIFEKIE